MLFVAESWGLFVLLGGTEKGEAGLKEGCVHSLISDVKVL